MSKTVDALRARGVAKARRSVSSEYLEAVLEQAREKLPPYVYAQIAAAARPSAGGRAREKSRRLSLNEKEYEPPRAASEAARRGLELRRRYGRGGTAVGVARARDLSLGRSLSERTVARMRSFFARHGAQGAGDPPRDGEEPSAAYIAWLLWGGDAGRRWVESLETRDAKGFAFGYSYVGAHAHGLDRRANVTESDGAHLHFFLVPGSGAMVATVHSGAHQHELGGDRTANDGAHSHEVVVMGDVLKTSLGGSHRHELDVETTHADGGHVHTLTLQDGTEITSLALRDLLEELDLDDVASGRIEDVFASPNRAAMLEGMIEAASRADEAVAASQPVPSDVHVPAADWDRKALVLEVVDEPRGTEVDVALADCEHGASVVLACGPVRVGDRLVVVDGVAVRKTSEPVDDSTTAAMDSEDEADRLRSGEVAWLVPEGARALFISASPNRVEAARGRPLAGRDLDYFERRYLGPLGLTVDEVALGTISPVWMPDPVDAAAVAPWLEGTKARIRELGVPVVAFGKAAQSALGELVDAYLPHPTVCRRQGDDRQVARKSRRIREVLDARSLRPQDGGDHGTDGSPNEATDDRAALADAESENGERLVAVTKADESQQIVYGVVLDPYVVDLQDDWAPPAEVRKTAHDYMLTSRVVGLEHGSLADAAVVESFVEPYPSPEDEKAADMRQPHRITRRKFGADQIHSGTWVLGVKLGDREWSLYTSGKIRGFSMGGFSKKSPTQTSEMPSVDVIDLVPSEPS